MLPGTSLQTVHVGFRVWGLGFRGLGFNVEALGCRDEGLEEFRVYNSARPADRG